MWIPVNVLAYSLVLFVVWQTLTETVFMCVRGLWQRGQQPESYRVNDAVRTTAREAAAGRWRDETVRKDTKEERESQD